jgi:hypothetical protein
VQILFFLSTFLTASGVDRVGDGVVDEVGGLDSIIKPFHDDLMDNTLFVARRMLRRMAPFAIFLASIHFLLDPSTGRCL